ncbi:hypothetical protein HOP50_08g52150 [Chloropicon primus]|nr:hypothetical protein A3770_08p51850 [Chloropicon primus]UPR01891.1 hypothetical protein HOP50_08g52150 [Chloropicon primus]|eukprot:QDZ22667.1 hypothetical protein A3770_08p51850 [Chloropicon primus]
MKAKASTVLVLLVLASALMALMVRGDVAGICANDPELAPLAESNPQVAQCCQQFDTLFANIDAVLQQGVTALVPVMGCTVLPPVELSQGCYQDLLAAGANCYYETNMMVQFFNDTGLLGTALDAKESGNLTEATGALPTEDAFKQQAIDYIPTAQKNLEALTGNPDINPLCCQSIKKLVADKCACEEKPMTFVNSRLEKVGLDLANYMDLAKTVVSKMNCDGADQLEVYPNCVA